MKSQFDIETIETVLAKADPLYTEREIAAALDEMAENITEQLRDKYPVCLSIMLGGLVPAGQLLPRLNFPVEVDYIHATRYRGTTQGGKLNWLKYPSISLASRTVLLIDDILDEGLTLQAVVEYCQQNGVKQVFTAVLVEKQHERRTGIQHADFTGLIVPDRYVFGYGMDYQEQLRYVAGIYAVHGL